MRHDHLPEGVTPWKNLWSAGQGVDSIDDVVPTVAELWLGCAGSMSRRAGR